jgi:hypothetical protein
MSYDYILQQRSGSATHDPDAIRDALSTIPELAIGEITSLAPLDVDDAIDFLLDGFEDEENAKQEYASFCARHGFPASCDEPDGAAALAYATRLLGVDLVVFAIPAGTASDGAQRALLALARFACAHQLALHDPQLGAEIDLDDPLRR